MVESVVLVTSGVLSGYDYVITLSLDSYIDRLITEWCSWVVVEGDPAIISHNFCSCKWAEYSLRVSVSSGEY